MGLLGLKVIRESVVLRIDTDFKGVIMYRILKSIYYVAVIG